MKRTILCGLITMLAVMAATLPSEAAAVRVSLYQPRMVDADTAQLTGRVTGRDAVSIQRYAPSSDRWVLVRRVSTGGGARYRTTVPATESGRWYRAVAGGLATSARLVQAVPVVDEPVVEDPVVEEPVVEEPVVEEPVVEEPVVEEPVVEEPVVEEPVVEEPPVPEVPPTPPPGPDPALTDECGARPLKADGSRWSCTLAEEFDGTALDRTLWKPAGGFLGGTVPARPCYVDDPSVISVQDGTLRLSARKVAEPVRCAGTTADPTGYIAGGVNTYRLFSQQYGRFEARYKSEATTELGLHEAFWLWPDDRYNKAIWPAAGEIDIAETYSQYPDLSVPFLHYKWNDNWGPVPGLNTAWNCKATRGVYNTFTLEWTATRLEILVNGRTCLVNTSADPAFQKPYIVALTQLMGTGPNMYDGKAPLPATMHVDYVRVWK
jgi:hypothetical protein